MNWDLDSLCDNFEAQLKEGRTPDVNAFLKDVNPEHRSELLRALLEIELWWNRHRPELLSEDDYRSRFPGDQTIIEEVFRGLQGQTATQDGTTAHGSEAVDNVSANDVAAHENPADDIAVNDAMHPALAETHVVSLPDDTQRRAIPRTLGDYELLREIARGGMGVVYEARQRRLNRIVALKTILFGKLASEMSLRRFQSEAEAAARLRHPGIIPIYEIGDQDGIYYYSMAFAKGQSLADLVKDDCLVARHAADIVRKLANAMAYAHEHHIIHRDLKPANVMIDDGEPRIMDFGLAKQLESEGSLTETGDIMGTPGYMPPEQATGRIHQVGVAADIYSLGAILYHLLLGTPPFRASTPIETIRLVIEQEPVAPRSLNPMIERDLNTICMKCLQKDPARRYANARELEDDLQRYLEGRPISAAPVGRWETAWRWCKRKPALASLVFALFLLILTLGIGGPYLAMVQTSALAANQRLNIERVHALVREMIVGNSANIPTLIKQVPPYEQIAIDSLQTAAQSHPENKTRLRAGIGLLGLKQPAWDVIIECLDDASPAEIASLNEIVSATEQQVPIDSLWSRLKTLPSEAGSLLSTAALIATVDPEPKKWAEVRARVVNRLVRASPQVVHQWAPLFSPVKEALNVELVGILRGSSRNVTDAQRVRAAELLAGFTKPEAEKLVPVLVDVTGDEFEILFAAAAQSAEASIPLLESIALARPEQNSESAMESAARRSVRAALALLRLKETGPALSLLEFSPDPRRRSYLIHWMREYRVEPDWILNELKQPGQEQSVTRALIQSLGEYRPDECSQATRQDFIDIVTKCWGHDDPGIHSSATWLLANWGQQSLLDRLRFEARVVNSLVVDRRWFIDDVEGSEFVVIEPGSFIMGSDIDSDPDSYGMREEQRPVTVRGTRAIATTPVTLAQYREFFEEVQAGEYKEIPTPFPEEIYCLRVVRTNDSPITAISWEQAAAYCNWLSQRANIPREEWCYELVEDESGFRMQSRADSLNLTGYRFPTQEEWEYAARAGTTTRRYYGYADELLPKYAWYAENSQNRTWPVGLKKPNDWGLFDSLGNVWEMCHDGVSCGGGCYDGGKWWARAAQRQALYVHDGTGFRVARTLTDEVRHK